MKKFIMLTGVVALFGCTTSGVVQTGPDSYMAREHSTAFTIDPGGAGAIANATELAAEHCSKMGKYLVVQGTQTTRVGAGAQAIVNFECLEKKDKDYVRPKLQSSSPNSGQTVIINN